MTDFLPSLAVVSLIRESAPYALAVLGASLCSLGLVHKPRDAGATPRHRRGNAESAPAGRAAAPDRDPERARAHHDRGIGHFEQGRVDEAIAAFRRAVELDRENAQVWVDLAVALGDRGDVADEIACYRMALTIDPDFKLAIQNLKEAREILANARKQT